VLPSIKQVTKLADARKPLHNEGSTGKSSHSSGLKNENKQM
jgi:hypothetical protein